MQNIESFDSNNKKLNDPLRISFVDSNDTKDPRGEQQVQMDRSPGEGRSGGGRQFKNRNNLDTPEADALDPSQSNKSPRNGAGKEEAGYYTSR